MIFDFELNSGFIYDGRVTLLLASFADFYRAGAVLPCSFDWVDDYTRSLFEPDADYWRDGAYFAGWSGFNVFWFGRLTGFVTLLLSAGLFADYLHCGSTFISVWGCCLAAVEALLDVKFIVFLDGAGASSFGAVALSLYT